MTIDFLAYLDPGTGSYLLQIIAAGSLSALLMIKTFWAQLKMFFSGKSAGDAAETDAEAETDSESTSDS